MRPSELQIGQRLYNYTMGVCAHWGTVTKIKKGSDSSYYIQITPEDQEGFYRDPYWVMPVMIHDVDKGNHSTNLVTEEAHRTYRAKVMANLRKSLQQMKSKQNQGRRQA